MVHAVHSCNHTRAIKKIRVERVMIFLHEFYKLHFKICIARCFKTDTSRSAVTVGFVLSRLAQLHQASSNIPDTVCQLLVWPSRAVDSFKVLQ